MADRARLVPGDAQVLGCATIVARERRRPGGQPSRSLPGI